jgi:Mn-dependent DtxR family transcriptional regulator
MARYLKVIPKMSKKNQDSVKEIAQELDVFDSMITALVELLEEKGI